MFQNRLLTIIFTFILYGCTGNRPAPERTNLDQLYQGGGVEKFFLPDLPYWANFSVVANCQRKETIRYLNFENLHKSYNLNYEQLVQLQYMFNRRLSEYHRNTGRNMLYMQDESYYFYNTSEQVQGGSRGFIVPDYKQINLIWIDPALSDDQLKRRLNKLMQSSAIENGHPVFVSTCMSAFELEKYIAGNGHNSMGVRGISQEMFSPYTSDYRVGHEYALNFSKFMLEKKIYLFAPWFPKEFKGVDKHIKY